MTQTSFELHSNLVSKDFIVDLSLCRVLLENESHYPWLFLVPRRNGVSKIIDLSIQDQMQLFKELDMAQRILWELFPLTQLNVAAIGNKTPQLHVHVIGRKNTDPAWPNTVWDHPIREVYSHDQKEIVIQQLRSAFAFKEN